MKKVLCCLVCLFCLVMIASCNAKHQHEWEDWKILEAADCEHAGSRERVCSCGEKEVEEIAVQGHSMNAVETIAPTAARQGYTLYSCSACTFEEKRDIVDPTGSQGLAYTVNDDKKTCTVTGIGTCTDTELGIPDFIDGYKVTAIGEYAFRGPSSLSYVWLGNYVETMGFGAFQSNSFLKEVVCGERLTNIAASAFQTCLRLEKIDFSDSITIIEHDAFGYCTRLVTLDFGEDLRTIEYRAFISCESLVQVTLPKLLSKIEDEAFERCYKLVEVINLSGLKLSKANTSNGYVAYYSMGIHDDASKSKIISEGDFLFLERDPINYLLAYTGNDTELVLPEFFKGENYLIYDYAFSRELDITSVTIPSTIRSFGVEAFRACSKLEKVEISDFAAWCNSVFETEASNPLYRAENLYLNGELLVSAKIPDGITEIKPYTFVNCKSIQSLIMPKSLVNIRENAFKDCLFLYTFYYEGTWDECMLYEVGNYPIFTKIYCYSAAQPTSTTGSYWRYVDGVPTAWN